MDLRTSENCPSFGTNSERKLENDSERVTLFSRRERIILAFVFAVDSKNVIGFYLFGLGISGWNSLPYSI